MRTSLYCMLMLALFSVLSIVVNYTLAVLSFSLLFLLLCCTCVLTLFLPHDAYVQRGIYAMALAQCLTVYRNGWINRAGFQYRGHPRLILQYVKTELGDFAIVRVLPSEALSRTLNVADFLFFTMAGRPSHLNVNLQFDRRKLSVLSHWASTFVCNTLAVTAVYLGRAEIHWWP